MGDACAGESLKRVVIDARMVGPVPHGVARYVSLLAKGLKEIDARSGLPYRPVFLVDPKLSAGLSSEVLGGFETWPVDAGYLETRELWILPRAIRRARADLYHSPSLSSLLQCPCPWISTVHDLNHLRFGSWQKRLYYRFVIRPFARGAKKLLTVSEFSRFEMVPWLGMKADTIGVVYNALDPKLGEPIDEGRAKELLSRHGLEEGKYFFCLSNSKPHKNVEMLVRAYQSSRSEWPLALMGWNLVVSLPAVEGRPGVIALGSLPDEEGRILLAKAGALAFPSLYEGFGLPPLEAAALGIPVIVSRIPAHQEALRLLRPDEVTWVEPTDERAWSNSLRLAASGNRPRPSAESRRRILEAFSPKRLGSEMDRIYRNMLGLGGS